MHRITLYTRVLYDGDNLLEIEQWLDFVLQEMSSFFRYPIVERGLLQFLLSNLRNQRNDLEKSNSNLNNL